MLPFILTAIGGYFIGSSMKGQSYADGGSVLSTKDKIRLREIDRQIKEELKTISEFEEDNTEREYDRFGNPSPLTWNQQVVMSAEENLEKLQEERKALVGKKMADGGEIESAAKRKADNPNWTNEKLLAEYNSLKIDLEDLKEGVITPRKVIGGGYKSSAVAKRIAKEWLENRIAEYKMALEIRGVMADGGPIDKAEIDIYKEEDERSYTGRSRIKVYYYKGDIGFDGRLKEYHTGIGWEMEFEPDYFDDKESEDYYDEHSDAIEEEILAYFYSNEWKKKMADGGEEYADGGDIAESNNRMLRSKVKEVKHHADELGRVVKPNTEVEGWVVAKAERSASDLSDITHYLDGQEFAEGGQIDEATISNIRRNIMGTISFDMKLKGMRKPQDFIVYPITSDSAGIKVQSDTRIGLIDLPTGRGLMSQSHSSGAYNHHLQLDKKTRFTLSDSDIKMLTDNIKGTAGSSVGTRGITTDNSGASKLADGGKTKYGYVPRFDRHKEMDGDTRMQILDVISDLDDTRLENYLYGLFDGYDYSGSEKFKESMEDLKKKDKSLHDKVKAIYVKIDKYEKYANGGVMKQGGEVYKLGDTWSSIFDYDGMLKTALQAKTSWGVKKLEKLSDSLTDVNYHTVNRPLGEAIEALKKDMPNVADIKMQEFHEAVKKEMAD